MRTVLLVARNGREEADDLSQERKNEPTADWRC